MRTFLYPKEGSYGMAVASGNNSCDNRSTTRRNTCNCYTVPGLIAPILESPQTSRLEDHYILGEQLGWGQFGVIRVCSNLFTKINFACKSILKDRLASLEDVCSIKLEIEIMSRLSGHPHVVDLKAVYEDESYIHLVMELCAGGELFHRLEKNGRFLEPNARILFRSLMEVVMYCHNNGVVHRDLKPENILLVDKSSSSPIKLADFGLATYIKPGQSLSGTVGSPFYIAPEVLSGDYTEAADVWSAGVILYVLLSGMPPFWGKTKSKIFGAVRATNLRFPSNPWDYVSTSAKDLISGMLCRDPTRRLTASQVLEHSWTINCEERWHQWQFLKICDEEEMSVAGVFPFSTPLNHDFSFGSGAASASALEFSTPDLSCKSSFSSFLVSDANANPRNPQGGFSFRSCGSIHSMPSFAFYNPEINLIQKESAAVSAAEHDIRELDMKGVEIRRGNGTGMIQAKRNRTIGLGEVFVQLDLRVTESIIRWTSCNLLGAPSSRSSLLYSLL